MTVATLKAYTLKDLAKMARQRGVQGWHSMRKDQLVRALAAKARAKDAAERRASKPAAAPATNGHAKRAAAATPARGGTTAQHLVPPAPGRRTAFLKRLEEVRQQQQRWKDLSVKQPGSNPSASNKDRLVVMVRDPFWLHAYWEITRQSVERAQAAMAYSWHSARPVLRLYEVTGVSGSGATAERWVGDIAIHGGVNNWYVDVQEPPKTFRLDIGYLSDDGKYHSLARSNMVTTPAAAESDSLDQNWTPVAEQFDKIFAMSSGYSRDGASAELQELLEERLRRPMGSPMFTRFGAGAESLAREQDDFFFQVEAEVILYGATKPGAYVTVQGEPVRLRPDGTFTMRLSLPDKRQVIPAVAASADGVEQRTAVIALERNTKYMEPLIRESAD
jgi:hypothetical protein